MICYITNYIITLRYIKLLSYYSAKHIQQSRQESHRHRYTYYYGFQIIYGAINKFILLILIGLLFNILPQLILVTLSFVSLRIFVGGLHFDSYTKCVYFSLISFVVIGLLAKYVYLNIAIIVIFFIIVFIIFLLYAPIEHQSRPLKNNEKIKFKIISLILLTMLFLVVTNTNSVIINNSVIYGVLLSGIITIPIVNKLK